MHANAYLLLTTLAQGLVMTSQTYTESWSGDVIANTPSSSNDNLIGNQSVDGTYCSNTQHTTSLTLPHAISNRPNPGKRPLGKTVINGWPNGLPQELSNIIFIIITKLATITKPLS